MYFIQFLVVLFCFLLCSICPLFFTCLSACLHSMHEVRASVHVCRNKSAKYERTTWPWQVGGGVRPNDIVNVRTKVVFLGTKTGFTKQSVWHLEIQNKIKKKHKGTIKTAWRESFFKQAETLWLPVSVTVDSITGQLHELDKPDAVLIQPGLDYYR